MGSLSIARPLFGNVADSFAYNSTKDRWPKIVTKIVDRLHCNFHNLVEKFGKPCGEEVTHVIGKISEMRYRMETNKPLVPFEELNDEFKKWNQDLENISTQYGETNLTWYDAPWLFVECYMYSKIEEFVATTTHLKDYDVFHVEKQKSFYDSLPQIRALAVELLDWECDNSLDTKTALTRLIQITLWGNKCDLSLSGGDAHKIAENIFHQLDSFRPYILSDQIDQAVNHLLQNCANSDVHFVLDNAGLEVVTDLALAEFLVHRKLVKRVVFHGKEFPWFVSDVTTADYKWVLKSLHQQPEKELQELGQRWQTRPEFIFQTEPFWTNGHSFWAMKEKSPELFAEFKKAGLVLFKGDLNYRKLVGDRDWPYGTPFKFAVQSMSEIPLFALRTLKAETVAGLPAASIDTIKEKFAANDKSWMVSSDYAVAQLSLP